jgi:hypothetical protein
MHRRSGWGGAYAAAEVLPLVGVRDDVPLVMVLMSQIC